MPQANAAAAAGAPAATAESNVEPQSPEGPMPEHGTLSSVMEKLGIPSEIRGTILEEHSEQPAGELEADAGGESEPEETETPAGDEPAGDEEPAGEDEPAGEEEAEAGEDDPDKVPENATPEWFNKRVGRLTRQRRAAERKTDEALERAEKAEALLAEQDAKPPVVFQPTPNDPLADVTDQAGLEKATVEAENLQDFCRANLNGYIAHQGTDKETFVSAQEVAATLRYAENVLNKHVPKKAEHLKQQPVFTGQAKQLLPSMFQRGTVEHQASQQILRDTPYLANDPQRDLKVAVQIIGWQTILANIQKAKEGGKNGASERILAARETNGKVPLTRTNPPVKPRAGVSIPSTKEAMDKAEREMIESGGSEEATRKMAREMIRATNTQVNGRQPALV